MDIVKIVVSALMALEVENGSSPSVAEIAVRAGLSNGTTHKYLKQAVEEGKIAQRDGKFMTLKVAEAYTKGR